MFCLVNFFFVNVDRFFVTLHQTKTSTATTLITTDNNKIPPIAPPIPPPMINPMSAGPPWSVMGTVTVVGVAMGVGVTQDEEATQ